MRGYGPERERLAVAKVVLEKGGPKWERVVEPEEAGRARRRAETEAETMEEWKQDEERLLDQLGEREVEGGGSRATRTPDEVPMELWVRTKEKQKKLAPVRGSVKDMAE